MATTETRLLLLGAVAIFEPVNGYQIRRELLSWGVESWANIRPGSIYNGLATLAAARRPRAARPAGRHPGGGGLRAQRPGTRASSARLYEAALTEVRPTAPLAFQTAISMLPLVDRARRAAAAAAAAGEPRRAGRRRRRRGPPTPEHVPAARAGDGRLLGARRAGRAGVAARAARSGSATASSPSSASRWTGRPRPTTPGTR